MLARVALLARELRTALRRLRAAPTFTATIVIVLALAIGMATAMATIVESVLLRRLPVQDEDRVLVMWTYRDPAVKFGLLGADLEQVRPASRTLSDVAGVAHWGAIPSPLVEGERALVLDRAVVSGNFFELLGARPAIGRLLRADDDAPGAERVLVLGYDAWRRHFGGDSAVVGRRVIEPYTRDTYTIVGVGPAGLDYPAGVDAWSPIIHPGTSITIVARLVPGATAAMARTELASIMQSSRPELRLTGSDAITFTRAVVGEVRPVLVLLTSAVALLLLIACVNVGGLLLLRAGGRAREIAIRRSLGAGYGDVATQFLAESIVLAVGGGVAGLACASGFVRLFLTFAPPQLPRVDVVSLAGAPLGAATLITIAALLLFGVVPALVAARGDGTSVVALGSRSGTDSRARRRVRQWLVASQVALAVVMLAAAGLLTRSVMELQRIELGYEPERLSIISVAWPDPKYPVGPALDAVGEELTRRWRTIPGISAVTPILVPPLVGANVFQAQLEIEGRPLGDRDIPPMFPAEGGGSDYFRTFGIPLLRGRGFSDSDRQDAARVAVVSESIAQRFWPNEDPLGKRIRFWSMDTTSWRTVVGVAGDIHYRTLREATPTVYIPWRQGLWQASFAIRTEGRLATVLPAMRRELRDFDPDLALWHARSMNELLAAPLAQPRLSASLVSGFGLIALTLAVLGMYAIMATAVREQTREIGVRMALGATPGRIRRSVLRRAVGITAVGAIAGLAGAFAVTRLLTSLLFEVSPLDPVALVGASVLLLAAALAAAYPSAKRATRIDPARALRAE